MLKAAFSMLTVFACSAAPSYSQSFQWKEIGGDLDLAIVSSTSGGSSFGVAGFAINQIGLKIELHTSISLIQEVYPDLSQDFFTVDQAGNRISVKPTVSSVWDLLSQNADVLGVVPVGYSETAGSPDVAGFYRIDGVSYNSVFSAPNMDTVLCLDDLDREDAQLQNFNVPFLFEANVGPRFSFTYEEDKIPVLLDHLSSRGRWEETFNSCEDMVQTGFRLIEPRHIMRHNKLQARQIQKLPVRLSVDTFPLTAMMFDRNGRFNFVRFGDINPVTSAEILSSKNFQQARCVRSVSGAENCEIWATMLTAFDDAAIIVRSGPASDAITFGDPQVIAPAVLVLRTRNAPIESSPINDDQEAETDALDY